MIKESFQTIEGVSEGMYKVKGSKFLAFAIAAENAEEIKNLLLTYRKKYYDARHICYAWVLGPERTAFRANDDGEPSGTAGKPILGQINSRELTNILVIVVRYFGGVLLGTGGLVSAYKEAAADALAHAIIIEKPVTEVCTINFRYESLNEVMRIIKDFDATILNQQFESDCVMSFSYGLSHGAGMMRRLEKIDFLKIISS